MMLFQITLYHKHFPTLKLFKKIILNYDIVSYFLKFMLFNVFFSLFFEAILWWIPEGDAESVDTSNYFRVNIFKLTYWINSKKHFQDVDALSQITFLMIFTSLCFYLNQYLLRFQRATRSFLICVTLLNNFTKNSLGWVDNITIS